MRRVVPILPLLLLVAALAPLRAAAEPPAKGATFADLDRKVQKDLAEKARAYFDPSIEFIWRPRKEFREALTGLTTADGTAIDALRDLGFLESLIEQGRQFQDTFDGKAFQQEFSISSFKTSHGLYNNVQSEAMRFTFTVPRRYPNARTLRKIPRDDPYPLLVSLHDEEDYFANRTDPGEACLDRRYPKTDWGDLYDEWITLAPAAPRAQWVEANKSANVGLLVQPLAETWRRYHVDFQRFILEGGEGAAAYAAIYPFVFAGLVLHNGPIEADLVPNYAALPIYVNTGVTKDTPADKKADLEKKAQELKKTLEDAGHPAVTLGDWSGQLAWMRAQRRKVPTCFHWTMKRPEHQLANWISISSADASAPVRSLDVTVRDTKDEPNTIQIDGKGIERISIFLNDDIVDLDRPVRLLLNGHEKVVPAPGRDFGTLFDKLGDNAIRKNMSFWFLYPALLPGVTLPAPAEPEKPATAPGGTEPAPAAGQPDGGEAPAEQPTPGDEKTEATAKVFFDKGQEAEQGGDKGAARGWYQKILDLGPSSYRSKAEERLKDLGGDHPN
jgi:hypothetical protein